MSLPVYLDYAATTPVDPRVAEAMQTCLTMDGAFANPASRSHIYGWQAEERVEQARCELAELIGAESRELVWTSGATESNNLALKGLMEGAASRGRHIVTSRIEHKAVLDVCEYLRRHHHCEVSYIEPEKDGRLVIADFERALRDDTALVSLMHVNNELGVINDIGTLGKLCRERGIVFHVDAAQSVGKLPIDVKALAVDLLSISGHKFYGPKGVGALYVRRSGSVTIAPQIHGGGHERGLRSGTLATHQLVGIGVAASIAKAEMQAEQKRLAGLKQRFLAGLKELQAIGINGSVQHSIAGIVNIHFAHVEGEALVLALRDIAISTGSACTSLTVEPSYVLSAMGLEAQLAHSSIRFSFGRFTTEQDVDRALSCVVETVNRLRSQSASWSAYVAAGR